MHEVLVNRLGGLSLPRKSVVRLTDRPDVTLDVYRGRKTTIQHQQDLEHQKVFVSKHFSVLQLHASIDLAHQEINSRTSVARTLMARLPWLFELVLESLGNNPIAPDLG